MGEFSLSPEEVQRFHAQGFFGPFKVYEPGEAQELWYSLLEKMLTEESKVYESNKYQLDRHLDIDLLSDHICNPRIVQRLQTLMGPDLLTWRTEMFSKKPGDTGTEWHQVESFAYGNNKKSQLVPTEKADWGIVMTVWFAWSQATKENGCLKFIPGSHKQLYFDETKDFQKKFNLAETGFYGYDFADLKKEPDWSPKESDAVYMEMDVGEAVIFTTRCVHGSTPNVTQHETRYSSNARYVPTSTQIFPGMKHVTDHGEYYDLENYSAVLVSGRDTYNHNKLATENLNGYPFKKNP